MKRGSKFVLWGSVLACFGIGLIAFAGFYHAMPLAVFLTFFWGRAENRFAAFLCAVAYYLGGLQGLFVGASVFFGQGFLVGGALWLAAALLHAAVWGLCWHREPRLRIGLLLVAILVSVFAPNGLVSWLHPLASAGVLFPRFGLWGFGLCILLLCAIATASTKSGRVVALVCVGLSIFANVRDQLTPRAELRDWIGHDTRYRNNAAAQDLLQQYDQQLQLIALTNSAPAQTTHLFPEISSGVWTDITANLWQRDLKEDRAVLLGAIELIPGSKRYNNVIVGVTKDNATVVYRQRMPSPVSMWRPWADNGCMAHWFENPVFTWRGKRVAGLICHEQFTIFPWVQSMICRPDAILATGNVWWAERTTIPALQQTLVRSWAALGNFPLVGAFNK